MEKFQCRSKRVISIGEQQVGSNIFMVVDFALNDTLPNLNAIQYSPAFNIDIAERSSEYAGLPLKVDLKKLISGNTTNLTHNYSPTTGKFYNQMIGSFCNFYTIGEGNSLELCGTVKIPKEFEQACEVIQELYDSDSLFVSYEIYVGKYTTINNGEVKYVDKDSENYLAAYSIVSQPAVVSAKALALVAEIIERGGEPIVASKIKYTQELFIADFKKNMAIKEIAELSYDQVMTQLWDQVKTALGDNCYDYYITDNGVDFVIMKSYDDGSLVKIDFSVDGDTVVILDCYPVTRDYNPINNNQNDEGGNGNMAKTVAELELEVANLKLEIASKDTEVTKKDSEVESSKKSCADKEAELEKAKKESLEKDTEVAEAKKNIATLSAAVLEKDNKNKELELIKASYDAIIAEKTVVETEAKKAVLKASFSKLLKPEVLDTPEMAEAINKLDEAKLNAKVVELAMIAATEDPTKKTTTSTVITASTVIGKGNDLVSKYVTIQE